MKFRKNFFGQGCLLLGNMSSSDKLDHTGEPHTDSSHKDRAETASLDHSLLMPMIEDEHHHHHHHKESQHTHLHTFDWKHGVFRHEGSMPLWARLFIQFLMAVLMTCAPPILSYMKLIPGAYPLISMEPPVKAGVLMEILRFVWLLGASHLVYVCIQLWLCLMTWSTYKMARLRTLLVEDTVRQSIEQTWSIRRYFGMCGAGVALSIFSRVLYPIPVDKKLAAAVAAAAATTGPTTAVQAAAKVAAAHANEFVAMGQNLQNYFHRPYQFFISSTCLAFAIVSVIFLVEKLILKAISHRYHTHCLQSRIHTNKFARKTTQSLKNYILAVTRKPKTGTNGELIFDFIGKPTIHKEDLYEYMDKDIANRFFSVLDVDLLGMMTKEQFCSAIDAMYSERNAIDRAFMDQCNILNKFDSLLMTIVWLLSFLISMVVMDPPIKFLVTFSITLLGGAMFMFRDTAKKAFDSIVFVIFTHPFDADDWILIREEMYQVHEVGLWTTTFLTSEGKLTYIANRNLVSVPITNLRRSPQMSETIPFTVLPSTSPEKIKALESRLVSWLKLHERDYSASMFIYGFKLVDKDHLKLEIKLTHKANFNDQTKKDMRTRRFVFKLKEYIKELGIELSPPLRSS